MGEGPNTGNLELNSLIGKQVNALGKADKGIGARRRLQLGTSENADQDNADVAALGDHRHRD